MEHLPQIMDFIEGLRRSLLTKQVKRVLNDGPVSLLAGPRGKPHWLDRTYLASVSSSLCLAHR